MPTITHNTPTLLIPKELFKEEKIHEYWNVLYPDYSSEIIGKDELENFYLLYPTSNNEDSIHEISVLLKDFKEKFPNNENAICINVYDENLTLLVVKNQNIEYAGYFHFSVKEDVLYHLTNTAQQFFENISQVVFCYQQIFPAILRLLENYYEMKKI